MLWYRRLLWFATALALVVVVLGAYVRLSDAGLGCPDWPGCYGELIPTGIEDGEQRGDQYPTRPVVETGKAWREMIHRYVAATLGFSIVLIAGLAWRNRQRPDQPVVVPLITLGVVIFQGLLGMWTVTLLLKPVIVMGHLLGGLTTLGLLFWLLLDDARRGRPPRPRDRSRWPAIAALVVLVGQIALGGWTSSNYAIWGCPDVPQCMGEWWPEQADFSEGFIMWRGIGIDYEFGVLEAPARVAIAFTHRLGALTTTLVLLAVTAFYWRRSGGETSLRTACAAVWAALAMQVTIGVSIFLVDGHLPVAAAHNGIAAVLLLTVVNLNHLAARA
jgi:cytochrome c oxidase assembly protein subunit 15